MPNALDKIEILGGLPLHGSVRVGGAKNAALPLLIASLLTDQPCTYRRLPHLGDIRTALRLLTHLGVDVQTDWHNQTATLAFCGNTTAEAPYELVKTMRASVVVLGPLLARFGHARVSLPGGCAIGLRPVNYHLEGLSALGASFELENGYIHGRASQLRGAEINLQFPSVGATQNILMAAVLARGESRLLNCAREPEIIDLGTALIQMGAQIEGLGSSILQVQGVDQLGGLDHEILGDRIEAATFLAAALATRSAIRVEGIAPDHLEDVLSRCELAGAQIIRLADSIEITAPKVLEPVSIATAPYPLFPTDAQAQWMAMLTQATGFSQVSETIFENRFMHVPELIRMGAQLKIQDHRVFVQGGSPLRGAPVMATDLRASASLVIAGLCAQGTTLIDRIYHLDRGYEALEVKLCNLGAQIKRVSG